MPSPTETFINTLKQTPPLASTLQGSLQRLRGDLQDIIKVLGYTKTIADKLDTLDNTLKTVSNLLTVASVIPEVGEAASALKNSIALLSKEVTPARNAADQLEAKVKPLRDALGKLDKALGDAMTAVAKVESVSQTFLDGFTTVVNCINSLPNGDYKQKGLAYLDQFSSSVEPSVATLNTALGTTNSAINTFYSALEKIKAAINPLSVIANAVDQVLGLLQPLLDPLNSIVNALHNIKITIPLPVPYPVTVSLYDIFTTFGSFIDLAMKPIQDLVNQLLSLLHITLPSIPGLSDLINLHIDIPSIPDFPSLQLSITNPFDQFNLAIPRFSLKCPPAPGDTAPVWK